MSPNIVARLKSLYIENVFFKLIGIELEARSEKSVLRQPILFIVPLISTILWTTSMASYIFLYTKDISAAATQLTVTMQCYISTVKICLYLLNGKQFAQLIRNIKMLNAEAKVAETVILTEHNYMEKLLVIIYSTTCTFTCLLYLIIPIAISVYDLLWNGLRHISLPFQGIFPYNHEQPFFFFVTYFGISLAVEFVACGTIAVDCMFCWLVYNVSAHFRIIYVRMQQLAMRLDEHEMHYQHFQKHIAHIVEYHLRVLAIVADFDGAFCLIILAEFTLNMLQICFTTFQLSTNPEPSNLIFVAMVLISVSFQLVIYGAGGEKIRTNCEMISNGFWLLLPWHRLNARMKRLLLMPLLRMQHTSAITGYFFVAGHSLLVWVFRTAGSFTALLNAVENKDD